MRIIALALITAVLGLGQATVIVSDQPSVPPGTQIEKYDASNRLEYICYAYAADRPTITYTQGGTLTNIVVATNVGTATVTVAHGLTVGNPVTIAGVTTDTDLNGTYIVQTVPTTLTFTITTASVADATYTDAGTTVVTTTTRTAAAIWVIQRFQYDASGNLTSEQWARSSITAKVLSSGRKFACDDASSLVYE